jgi:hypothetical protein
VIQKRTNQKIGEILLSMGLIGENSVLEALENQATEIILSLFKWKKGEYNFTIMTSLDDSLRTIGPIATENLIMEGVQMLDEWPLIKELIPNDKLVFEPVPIESRNIEIVDEQDEEFSEEKGDKIYINESEANILKYINGKNTVKDLVEMGVFTEYKVYKSLYNLIRKSIITSKEKGKTDKIDNQLLFEEMRLMSEKKISLIFNIVLAVLLLLLVITFFNPLRPFSSENIIIKQNLINIMDSVQDIKP